MPMPKNWKALSAVAVTLLLWASAFAGIKAGLSAYTPGQLALLRFLFGSSAMALFARLKGIGLPERRDIPRILIVGFLGFTVYHVFLNYGEQSVSAGGASLIVSFTPVMTAILASLLLGERLRPAGWAGQRLPRSWTGCAGTFVKGIGCSPLDVGVTAKRQHTL